MSISEDLTTLLNYEHQRKVERRVYLLTPTSGRPQHLRMVNYYLGEAPWDSWVVATDCPEDEATNTGQNIVRRQRAEPENTNTVVQNVLAGLDVIPINSKVIIIEDDDYYGEGYVELMSDMLDHVDLVGIDRYWIYNLAFRKKMFRNISDSCPLAATSFNYTPSIKEQLARIGEDCIRRGDPYLDASIWNGLAADRAIVTLSKRLFVQFKNYGTGKPGVTGSHFDDTAFRHRTAPGEVREILGKYLDIFKTLFGNITFDNPIS